jgi:hypothetical protein
MFCFIFRNWNMVKLETLAKILGTSADKIAELAKLMGKPPYSSDTVDIWQQRGYITLLRQNWHLLPYEQLLVLLNLSSEELAYRLKEDDFLWGKLGLYKPRVTPVSYLPPTAEELSKAQEIGNTVNKYFAGQQLLFKPFEFKPCAVCAPEKSEHLRMLYPYAARYGDPLLDDEITDYSDTVLESYAASGINALWMQAVLYNLIPWEHAPEMSGDYRRRLVNLRKLTERAARYGIRIYLYLNEPRTISREFADKFTDLKGIDASNGTMGLCTSKKAVREYLKNAMEQLFVKCPGVAGVILINRSENRTCCASHNDKDKCPLCSKRSTDEIIAEVISAVAQGVFKAKPSADVMVHSWMWESEYSKPLIEKLPENVKIIAVSEWEVETNCEGIRGKVIDYSISHPGPGKYAGKVWQLAERHGSGKIAKIQLNNSWEMSAVPYIPAFDLVEKHLGALRSLGIYDYMLSWTHGGIASPLSGLLSKSRDEVLLELYGHKAFPLISKGITKFCEGFEHFPFHSCYCIYFGPQNFGPANLLWLEDTKFEATMLGFPFDDLETWRGPLYTEKVFMRAFQRLTADWKTAFEILQQAGSAVPDRLRGNYTEMLRYVNVCYLHFQSSLNQIRFIIDRREIQHNLADILMILNNEIKMAVELCRCQCDDSKIGFEASNHYLYTPNQLMEKVINCEFHYNYLITKYKSDLLVSKVT